MNAANELAVSFFLDRQIGFMDIYRLCAPVVHAFADRSTPDLATILELDAEARRMTLQLLKGMQ